MCIKGEFRTGVAGPPPSPLVPRHVPVPFTKPWLDYPQQIALLTERGLVVPDAVSASQFLGHVNYYRFSGYCLAFESSGKRHAFVPGTTFAQVKAAYEFDFALRDLLGDAMEIVEVDLRTAVAHHFGQRHGPFGHTNPANFYQPNPATTTTSHRKARRTVFQHANWLVRLRDETDRSKELFVLHHERKYAEFPDLPVWVATEVMSFGALSWMIEGMDAADQRAVAARYGIQSSVLTSWVHHLSVVRNLCAHHCRLWDRFWPVRPELPAGPSWRPPYLIGNARASVTLLILHQLLKRCLPAPEQAPAVWKQRADTLLAGVPAAPAAMDKLGLTPEWFTGPLWR